MHDSSALRAALQRDIDRLSHKPGPCLTHYAPFGHQGIDDALGGGLARAKLHEVIADRIDDASSAAGFAAMCARLIGGPLLWLCIAKGNRAALNPHGLHEIGIDPHNIIFVLASDPPTLLRAANEAMRCSSLGVVIIELWNDPQRIDLTVSRRLMLAAETSGVTPLLLRIGVHPLHNAAQTRWSVRAAPSIPLENHVPGPPAIDLDLLRQRGGPAGLCWRVEWNREEGNFRAPLPGTVAAVPVRRPLADDAGEQRYGTG